MIYGLDLRFYMRSWLKLDEGVDYTFKQFLEDVKEEIEEEVKEFWTENGLVFDEEIEFKVIRWIHKWI